MTVESLIKGHIAYVVNQDHVLVIIDENERTQRIMFLYGFLRERFVVHSEREEIIRIAIKLFNRRIGDGKKKAVRRLAIALTSLFDFRKQNAPDKSLHVSSIETEIHNLIAKMQEEREESRWVH